MSDQLKSQDDEKLERLVMTMRLVGLEVENFGRSAHGSHYVIVNENCISCLSVDQLKEYIKRKYLGDLEI